MNAARRIGKMFGRRYAALMVTDKWGNVSVKHRRIYEQRPAPSEFGPIGRDCLWVEWSLDPYFGEPCFSELLSDGSLSWINTWEKEVVWKEV